MNDSIVIIAFSAWCSVLTVLILNKKDHDCHCKPVQTGPTGPVIIKNFLKDRFGNIIKKDKREPRRGDDLAAYIAERKAVED